MRIGVDFDDVLAQFNKGFIPYHNRRWGTRVSFEQVNTYHLYTLFGITRNELLLRTDDFVDSLDHMLLDPQEGALAVVPLLARDHTLHIITSRGEEHTEATRSWARNYFSDVFEGSMHFANGWSHTNGHKSRPKMDICRELGIDFMIEDSLDHCVALNRAGVFTPLMDKPWNRGVGDSPLLHRIHSWYEVPALVESYKNGRGGR